MGACAFITEVDHANVAKAFSQARREALYMYGHAGYTGTIAEKQSYKALDTRVWAERLGVTISPVPTQGEVYALADKMLEHLPRELDDKWGPCGALHYVSPQPGWVFFGYASS